MKLQSVLEAVHASSPQVDLPFLCFHSERDTLTDPDGSKLLYARAKSADKTLKLVNQMWHVLTREDGNEQVLADIMAWMDERYQRYAEDLEGPSTSAATAGAAAAFACSSPQSGAVSNVQIESSPRKPQLVAKKKGLSVKGGGGLKDGTEQPASPTAQKRRKSRDSANAPPDSRRAGAALDSDIIVDAYRRSSGEAPLGNNGDSSLSLKSPKKRSKHT